MERRRFHKHILTRSQSPSRNESLDMRAKLIDVCMRKDATEIKRFGRAKASLMLLLCLAACFIFLISLVFKTNASVTVSEPTGRDLPANLSMTEQSGETGDFLMFSHTTPRHASLSCASCHRRETNSPRPDLPGHKACTDCHVQQFVSASGGEAICAICHTNLDSGSPAVKAFPSLKSFNARFDHAQHASGAARPQAGCVACHTPARRGVALSILVNLDAHANCYQCHSPGATNATGGDISTCGVCHEPGRLTRTSTNARSFALSFSHAAHGSRQNLSCADCHTVKANLPQSRQVESPRPSQHFPPARARSCATCHDNRRAFGGEDFADCRRCHRGATFRLSVTGGKH